MGSVTGAHTQNFESLRHSVDETISKSGKSGEHMAGYLAKLYWKTVFPD